MSWLGEWTPWSAGGWTVPWAGSAGPAAGVSRPSSHSRAGICYISLQWSRPGIRTWKDFCHWLKMFLYILFRICYHITATKQTNGRSKIPNFVLKKLMKSYPVSSNIDPLLHWPRCGPCMMLAGLLDAPRGSEWATSSISSTDGPPRLVLLFDRRLGPCLGCTTSLDDSPLLLSALPPSESDAAASAPPWVELELSLLNRPMIDLGCFGFSIPPNKDEKDRDRGEKKI